MKRTLLLRALLVLGPALPRLTRKRPKDMVTLPICANSLLVNSIPSHTFSIFDFVNALLISMLSIAAVEHINCSFSVMSSSPMHVISFIKASLKSLTSLKCDRSIFINFALYALFMPSLAYIFFRNSLNSGQFNTLWLFCSHWFQLFGNCIYCEIVLFHFSIFLGLCYSL